MDPSWQAVPESVWVNLSHAAGSFPSMAKQNVGARVNKASNCPNCGEKQLVPIVYGFPSEFTRQLSQKGGVELGGCIISGDDPSLRCRNCHHDVWRDGRTTSSTTTSAGQVNDS